MEQGIQDESNRTKNINKGIRRKGNGDKEILQQMQKVSYQCQDEGKAPQKLKEVTRSNAKVIK
jgi:hypothetical protein